MSVFVASTSSLIKPAIGCGAQRYGPPCRSLVISRALSCPDCRRNNPNGLGARQYRSWLGDDIPIRADDNYNLGHVGIERCRHRQPHIAPVWTVADDTIPAGLRMIRR